MTHYSGGSRISRGGGGRGPRTPVLFGENVCKNERIGSHGGRGHVPGKPPRSTNTLVIVILVVSIQIVCQLGCEPGRDQKQLVQH